jgi:hypothetical protein
VVCVKRTSNARVHSRPNAPWVWNRCVAAASSMTIESFSGCLTSESNVGHSLRAKSELGGEALAQIQIGLGGGQVASS